MSFTNFAPFCPVPGRIVPSHWMAHLPFAFWLVEVLKPRLLVELGTYHGASFCAFCQQMAALNIEGEAYAVDLWSGDQHMGNYSEDVYEDLSRHIAAHYSSFAFLLRMSFDEAAGKFHDTSIDLLHLDGCHTKETILHDFDTWLPKMSPSGVILIHDICTRLSGYGGVDAWNIIRDRFPAFAFTHGYGLGVVLPGTNIPDPLRSLLEDTSKEHTIAAFHAQGKIYERLFALEDQRKAEKAQAAHRENELQTTINKLTTLLAEERSKSSRQVEEFKEALLHEQLQLQALTGSLSWKMTAPLRRLAALCRQP